MTLTDQSAAQPRAMSVARAGAARDRAPWSAPVRSATQVRKRSGALEPVDVNKIVP